MLSGRSTARSIVPCSRSTVRSIAPTREWGTCNRSTARSTVPIPESTCSLAGRPLGRPCLAHGRPSGRSPPPESGALAVGRPLGRLAQVAGQACTFCARQSTGPVDRLWVRSTGPVDCQSLAGWVLGQKTELKIILKIPINLLKIHKNSF